MTYPFFQVFTRDGTIELEASVNHMAFVQLGDAPNENM